MDAWHERTCRVDVTGMSIVFVLQLPLYTNYSYSKIVTLNSVAFIWNKMKIARYNERFNIIYNKTDCDI